MRVVCLLPPLLAALITMVTPSACAQSSLRDAFEAAWRRAPQAQAAEARAEEFAARRQAAEAFLPGPPALGLEHWNDRASRNDGFRKYAGEIAVPLWLPGQKDRAQAVIGAERGAYEGSVALARLRVAGETRDAYWLARSAAAEASLAEATLENFTALEADVARRVKAGELARVDGNRALAEAQSQRIAVAEARARAQRAIGVFAALTGMPRLPDTDEERGGAPGALDDHPALRASAETVVAMRARLAQVRGDVRDAPEIGVGTFRERSEFTRPWEQIVTLRLRVPFGNDNRNRPRIAAANVELIEAMAAQGQAAAQVRAEIESSARELAAAEAALPLAESRLALASDTRQLVERGFRAGEFDLTARLRAEREHSEAALARAKVVLEAGRARSRHKQSLGLLP